MGRVILRLTCMVLLAQPVSGQDKNWSARGELGASVFFGNTSQSAVTTGLFGEVGEGFLELSGRFGFAYGEATTTDGVRFVNKRAWDLSADLNLDPGTPLKGFFLGKIESAFEKKIDLRYHAGGGGKYQLDVGDTLLEWSLAVIAEKTVPRSETGADSEVVAKWSVGFRFVQGDSDSKLSFESDTSYEPEASRPSAFTFTSRQTLSFQLNQRIAIQLSFVDSFDSKAEGRGARSNNDGQLFFGVASTF